MLPRDSEEGDNPVFDREDSVRARVDDNDFKRSVVDSGFGDQD